MNIKEIETPAVVLDLQAMKFNMDVMDSFLKGQEGVRLRPHFKTCKTIEIAKMQMERGAVGITAAKLSEAEVLINAGFQNVLIANQVVQQSKIERLAMLAGKTHLIVCVDQEENIRALSKAAVEAGNEIYLYIEYDIEMHRCGVDNYDEFYQLAKLITELPGITFSGIQAYAGHLSHIDDLSFVQNKVEEYEAILRGLKQYVEERGIPVKDISGASTNTARFKAGHGVYTELQPGSYVFMDQAYLPCKLPFKNSLFILSTVVSKSQDRIVLDVGAKGLGLDQVLPSCVGFEENEYTISEEHFTIHGKSDDVKVGNQMYLVPGHCCTTINLYQKLYVKDGEEITQIWNVEGSLKSV